MIRRAFLAPLLLLLGAAGAATAQSVEQRTANDGNVILSGIPEIPEAVSERLAPYQEVPKRQASKIAAPLFVIQGENDPRVPVTESEQIVQEVRVNGRPVWYMKALNEGHGFARKENQDLMRDAVALFIEQVLAAEGAQAGAVRRTGLQ